ncbi:ER to Golgi transport protein Yif1 [Polychaeton citri CBS 116435]|uniref:Protein YIF1 n=1 Tax=Polychaeton citri CBS 116435 TaxID=1314669 RepID=A0A9P4UJ16_9PEZI|nr:ER to Golgi transport protein Yif1 [Polychaeton citri CBS 116435]
MYRPAWSDPLANSPPLHHPVPQHVSIVPQLRSPPPPTLHGQGSQQDTQGGQRGAYGYSQSPLQSLDSGVGSMHPAFGSILNDPTAQLGFQVGQNAVIAGQEYVQYNFNRYLNTSATKHYFNVSNTYVLAKLAVILFPWRHRPWLRQQSHTTQSSLDPNSCTTVEFLPPRRDVNSPDMYIPLMAFVTYILVFALIAGLNGRFEPQMLGITFSNAAMVVGLELAVLLLGRYILSITSKSQIYEFVAYSGYKFVGISFTISISTILASGSGRGLVGWTVFAYTFLANALFLLRSLKYVFLPSENSAGNPGTQIIARSQRKRRSQFLVTYSYLVQFASMLWLSSIDINSPIKGGRGGK